INAIKVGAYLPDEMVDRLFDAQYQYRQASQLLVSTKDIPTPPTPDDAVLEAFYKENQKEFETPELRTITMLLLDPAIVGKDIPITDAEIKATYEAKSELFDKKKLEDVKTHVEAEVRN